MDRGAYDIITGSARLKKGNGSWYGSEDNSTASAMFKKNDQPHQERSGQWRINPKDAKTLDGKTYYSIEKKQPDGSFKSTGLYTPSDSANSESDWWADRIKGTSIDAMAKAEENKSNSQQPVQRASFKYDTEPTQVLDEAKASADDAEFDRRRREEEERKKKASSSKSGFNPLLD